MVHQRNPGNSKCRFPRCEELRNLAGLSKAELAEKAGVSVDLVRSLERGNIHLRYKVMRVFRVLQENLSNELHHEEELAPPFAASKQISS